MTWNDAVQLALYLAALLLLIKPLGLYMARIYEGKQPGIAKILQPAERLIYALCGVRPESEMTWQVYTTAMMLFNAAGFLAVYTLQRLQAQRELEFCF